MKPNCKLPAATKMTIRLCLAFFPVSFLLPKNYFFENSWIENLQVFILVSGITVSYSQIKRTNILKIRRFWQGIFLLWFIAISRELSWGRAFYPVGTSASGPVFLPLHELWYGKFVYPALALVILASIFLLFISRRIILEKIHHFQVLDVLAFCILLPSSQLVFEKGLINSLASYAQQLEESAELIAYWCLLAIQFSCIS